MDSLTQAVDTHLPREAQVALVLVGALVTLQFAYRTVAFVANTCFRSALAPNLRKRYGEGAWAVVTGATAGIGLSYAKEYKQRGMNVLLISRSEAKLQKVKEDLESIGSPDSEVQYVAADFTELEGETLDRVATALEDINVGVLVNNCGLSYPHAEYLDQIDDALVDRLIEVNVRALTIMTRLVLPQMVARKSGDIVNVTSVAGVWQTGDPLYAVYSGTKGYVNFFSRSLHHEYKSKGIHVQCHVPHFVATKMSKVKPSWPLIPTPGAWARAAVNHVGMRDYPLITPHWAHDLVERLIDSLPLSAAVSIVHGHHKDIRKRALKKKAIQAFEQEYLPDHPEIAELPEKERRKAIKAAFKEQNRKSS